MIDGEKDYITDKGAEKVQEFLASQGADPSAAGLRVGCTARPRAASVGLGWSPRICPIACRKPCGPWGLYEN